MLADVWKKDFKNLMVVSPDVGGVVRARALAKRLECELAIIDKRRQKATVSEVMNLIGEVEAVSYTHLQASANRDCAEFRGRGAPCRPDRYE